MTYFSISSQILVEEAKNMWMEVEILMPEKNFFLIKWNWKEIYFKNNDFWWGNTSLWYKIANDKELTNLFLDRNWFNIPRSIYLKKEDVSSFDI